MRFLVGTSGWSYPAWRGSFYPASLPAGQMLSWYSARFPVVEVNMTFYRMPSAWVFASWRADAPPGFTFALKAPRTITHEARLAPPSADILSRLLDAAVELEEALGPILFQLPPWMTADVPRLEGFLDTIPSRLRTAFEFRHPSWFSPEVMGALRSHGAALCVSESDRLATPLSPTARWGYLRLRRTDYSEDELRAWARRISAQPWDEVLVFLKHDESGLGPVRAARLASLLEEESALRQGEGEQPRQ